MFAMLPRPLLRAVDELSREHASVRRKHLRDERVRLMDELAAARDAAAANREALGLRNTVAVCQFNQADLQGLLDMFNAFGTNDTHRVEHERLGPLEVPDEHLRAVMEVHQAAEVADHTAVVGGIPRNSIKFHRGSSVVASRARYVSSHVHEWPNRRTIGGPRSRA